MGIVGGLVVPHELVLIPEVGRGRERDAVRTIGALRRAGRLVAELQPEVMVVLFADATDTPALLAPAAGTYDRDFLLVDAPELSCTDPFDAILAAALAGGTDADWERIDRALVPDQLLAPLYFLSPAGALPLLLVKLPRSLEPVDAYRIGELLARACTAAGRRALVVAAGELSSRVFPGAPGGYRPDAVAFDRDVVERVTAGRGDELLRIDPSRRQLAKESLLTQLGGLLGATGAGRGTEVLSYEHPYGVGYLVAAIR